MPLSVLDADRDGVMLALYKASLIGAEPKIVADFLGLPGAWVRPAEQFFERDQRG